MDTLGRDGVQGKSFQQRPNLVIAEGRGLAFVSVDLRSFDPMPRVAAGHRIAFQQVVEQAGQRRQFATDGGAGQPALLQLGALGQYMRTGHRTQLIRCS